MSFFCSFLPHGWLTGKSRPKIQTPPTILQQFAPNFLEQAALYSVKIVLDCIACREFYFVVCEWIIVVCLLLFQGIAEKQPFLFPL